MDFNTNNQGYSGSSSQSAGGGMAGWLVSHNIVQSEAAANLILIAFIIVGFCITGYVMYTHFF